MTTFTVTQLHKKKTALFKANKPQGRTVIKQGIKVYNNKLIQCYSLNKHIYLVVIVKHSTIALNVKSQISLTNSKN